MVVECGHCSTRFELDAAKIPDSGIRVRCSRCKHAFFLQHPSQSQASAVEAVVAEAVEHDGLAAPGSTQDLPMEPRFDSASAAVAPALEDSDAPDDEDDWEFNEEPETGDDGVDGDDSSGLDSNIDSSNDPQGLAVEYGGGLAGSSSSGGFGGGDPAESASIDLAHDRSLSESGELGKSGLDFAEMSADDLTSSSMCIDKASPTSEPDLEQTSQPASELQGARKDVFGAMDDLSASMPAEDPGLAGPSSLGDERNNEDPENWDFFGDQSSSPVGLSSAPEPMQDLTDDQTNTPQNGGSPQNSDVPSAWLALESEREVGPVERIASALAWVALAGLLTAGVYLGVTGSFAPGVRTPAFVSMGQMRGANIRGQWLETARAGILYVVTGDLVNPGTRAMALGQVVRVGLLGKDGRDLDLPPVFAGRDIEFDDLRQMSIDELRENQRATALALATSEIGPGQSARFTAAFASLPDEASHFQLRVEEAPWVEEVAGGDGATNAMNRASVADDFDAIATAAELAAIQFADRADNAAEGERAR